jgi:Flp pilus assembly protein TadB
MLTSMVAMPQADLIVAALWVGGLSLFLLGQAFAGWVKLRYARRSARHASRLVEATRDVSIRRSTAQRKELLADGARPPSSHSGAA